MFRGVRFAHLESTLSPFVSWRIIQSYSFHSLYYNRPRCVSLAFIMFKMYTLYLILVQLAYGAQYNYNQSYSPMGSGAGPGNAPPQAFNESVGQGGVGFQSMPGGAQTPPLAQLCSSQGPEAVHTVRCSSVSPNDMVACFGVRDRTKPSQL